MHSVLMFGSETWVVTAHILILLEGFHNCITFHLKGQISSNYQNGGWVYTDTGCYLEGGCILPIDE